MSLRASFAVVAVFSSVALVGCAQPSAPDNPFSPARSLVDAVQPNSAVDSGKPEYELAYYNGAIVTMNHIEVHQSAGALEHAAADLYAVIYPTNHASWPSPPLCNPCIHNGNAIFHDHVLDSIPSSPGHGEFNPLWHVFVIRPANASAATQAAYAARLPMTSEAAVDAAIAAGVAIEVDTHGYFICSIVNEHAAK